MKTPSISVSIATAADANELAAFAEQRPLARADIASIAALKPAEPRVIIARQIINHHENKANSVSIVASAIDDGLAMTVSGDSTALMAIRDFVGDLEPKLVISGRTADVQAFTGHYAATRRERREYLMAVDRKKLRYSAEELPLRIATERDLDLLKRVRVAALEEEYGIPVPADSKLRNDLETAVSRAVGMRGVALWVENDLCAFTAQLIAKTDEAAMFGDLYVDPKLRRSGRARRALTTFCTWLLSESEHVTLRVGVNNTPAVKLYQKLGFEIVDNFMSSLSDDAPGSERIADES